MVTRGRNRLLHSTLGIHSGRIDSSCRCRTMPLPTRDSGSAMKRKIRSLSGWRVPASTSAVTEPPDSKFEFRLSQGFGHSTPRSNWPCTNCLIRSSRTSTNADVNIEYVHAIPQPLGQPKATGNSVDAGMHVTACGSTFADCRRVPSGGSQCDGVMRISLQGTPVSITGSSDVVSVATSPPEPDLRTCISRPGFDFANPVSESRKSGPIE